MKIHLQRYLIVSDHMSLEAFKESLSPKWIDRSKHRGKHFNLKNFLTAPGPWVFAALLLVGAGILWPVAVPALVATAIAALSWAAVSVVFAISRYVGMLDEKYPDKEGFFSTAALAAAEISLVAVKSATLMLAALNITDVVREIAAFIDGWSDKKTIKPADDDEVRMQTEDYQLVQDPENTSLFVQAGAYISSVPRNVISSFWTDEPKQQQKGMIDHGKDSDNENSISLDNN